MEFLSYHSIQTKSKLLFWVRNMCIFTKLLFLNPHRWRGCRTQNLNECFPTYNFMSSKWQRDQSRSFFFFLSFHVIPQEGSIHKRNNYVYTHKQHTVSLFYSNTLEIELNFTFLLCCKSNGCTFIYQKNGKWKFLFLRNLPYRILVAPIPTLSLTVLEYTKTSSVLLALGRSSFDQNPLFLLRWFASPVRMRVTKATDLLLVSMFFPLNKKEKEPFASESKR